MIKLNCLSLFAKFRSEKKKQLSKKGAILPVENRFRLYKIFIELEDIKAIEESFDVTLGKIKERMRNAFLNKLLMRVSRELRKSEKKGADIILQPVKESDEGTQQKAEDANYDDDRDDDEGEEKTGDKRKKSKRKASANTEKTEDNSDEEPDDAMLKVNSQYFKKLKYLKETATWKITLKFPLEAEKVLMVNLVENTLADVCVSETPGINRCFVVKSRAGNKDKFQIQTEGVNFKAIWNLEFVKKNTIVCNDICEIYEIYGIEAARSAIIAEINRVFKPYGISVDFRHTSLIADFMTFNGRLRPLTREGIAESISPFLKMSYEMASRFLANSASHMEYEAMKTPSAQIVLGRAPKVGTGMFDVMHKLSLKTKA
mmetsp:Transcript_77264/g.89944  ORF Transcript_77264/g.89944 Transcript_77264/m.89944 type:complete len:373 (-) Transcript_77264:164-1282(-)